MDSSTQTHDWLLGGKVEIAQPRKGYRVSVDAIFLAAAVAPMTDSTVLDIGCGDGGATLCLAWRVPGLAIDGLDLRADALDRFSSNVSRNGWQDRVRGFVHDVADAPGEGVVGAYDWTISNPPYLPAKRMDQRGKADGWDPATTELVELSQWISFMAACLSERGHLALVHRADRIEDVLSALMPYCGAIRVFPLWPKRGAEAKRVIVTAQKGARGPSKILSGLVLHEYDGSFTPAAQAVLIDGEALDLA
ncbi:MAG: methyltransferase [Alphaproteobacteria bacterium]|nr:methyltransferase [Alphaproteobacteria bacterium]